MTTQRAWRVDSSATSQARSFPRACSTRLLISVCAGAHVFLPVCAVRVPLASDAVCALNDFSCAGNGEWTTRFCPLPVHSSPLICLCWVCRAQFGQLLSLGSSHLFCSAHRHFLLLILFSDDPISLTDCLLRNGGQVTVLDPSASHKWVSSASPNRSLSQFAFKLVKLIQAVDWKCYTTACGALCARTCA